MFAEEMLKKMYFNTAFIGLPNISYTGILSTSSLSELSIKKAVIEHSERTVILVDSSKLGNPDFLQFGLLSEVDTLITDSNMPKDFLNYCENIGVNVIVAEV